MLIISSQHIRLITLNLGQLTATFSDCCLARNIPYSPKYALNLTISSLLVDDRTPVIITKNAYFVCKF